MYKNQRTLKTGVNFYTVSLIFIFIEYKITGYNRDTKMVMPSEGTN